MDQIGMLEIIFKYFEKYILKDEDIKSVRMLFIDLLKKKLTKADVDNMMNDLLKMIENIRNKQTIDSTIAHNITLILSDLGVYKDKFEVLLQKESSNYYKRLSG